MPPLASTNRGRTRAQMPSTRRTRCSDTALAMFRLAPASAPVSSLRLDMTSTSRPVRMDSAASPAQCSMSRCESAPATMRETSSSMTFSRWLRASSRAATWADVLGTWLPTTTRPPRPRRRGTARSRGPRGASRPRPMRAETKLAAVRHRMRRPFPSARSRPETTTCRSSSLVAFTTQTAPGGSSCSCRSTAAGPPCRMDSREMECTSAAWMRPPVFSSTHRRRWDSRYPNVASLANSVSPAGTSLSPCCT
mmetsp:Transcript_30429/g.85192  ORF Transcript_30429/g.85192 Transcript_30429/m.85192 type:complete len:251 (-) Transcript_30429:1357-2109(-)